MPEAAQQQSLSPGVFREKLEYHFNLTASHHEDSFRIDRAMADLVKTRVDIEKRYAADLRNLSEALTAVNLIQKVPGMEELQEGGRKVTQHRMCM